MKKILTFLLIVAMPWVLMSQNTENQLNKDGKKHGYWKKYDENGKLRYEGNFNNGVPVGTFKYYHPNGKLESKTNFIEGTHKVHTLLFDQNEKLAAEGDFVDQLKDGEWNYYNEKGTLIQTEHFREGVKHGEFKTYSSQTGILLDSCRYDNGLLYGDRVTYFTDGKISARTHYINGEMNGLTESYFPNEVLFYKGNYLHGLAVGNWEFYDEQGRPRKTLEYKDGAVEKTYLFLNIAGGWQKVNQANIAYFHKEGQQTRVTTTSGKTLMCTQVFEDLLNYVDFVDFVLINANYAVSYGSLVRYRDGGRDRVEVELYPATAEPVICEGDYAKSVKMLFNNEVPKED